MTEHASLCECGHPFDGSHRTPGTECAELDCKCGRFKAAPSLFDDLDATVLVAVEAVGALYESLTTEVAHPQEFGMEGCPACRTRDLVAEAADALTQARELLALWQPESMKV